MLSKTGSKLHPDSERGGGNILPKRNLTEKGKEKAALITENASLE